MSDLLKSLSAKYDEMNAEIAAIQKRMTDESKQYIEQACAEMFAACPEVHRIHWAQYSPYFNDGEECYFSVHDVCYVLEADLDEDGEWEEGMYEGSRLYTNEDIVDAENDLQNAIDFNADPEAWRRKKFGDAKYHDALVRDKNNTNAWRRQYELTAKPYPSEVDEAEARLDKVKKAVASLEGREDVLEAHVQGVVNFINKIPDDVMETLFGNHVAVVITRDGMDIDEYDHD